MTKTGIFSASSKRRLTSMLKVDFRRMYTMPFVYIMVGIAFVMPILVLVMTTLMAGTTSVNPSTGVETTIEGFKNVWQIIGTVPSESSAMAMDITAMCNINLIYFIAAVLVCIFISEDFRSGYSKHLFTVRANKSDYVASKTITCFVACSLMLIVFFVGAMIGGAIAGLPFELGSVTKVQVIMCMLSKIFLMAVFVSIYVTLSAFAKQKAWLSILLALGGGMLLFAMVPMITPLNATFINVIMCFAGGLLFSIGLGFASKAILDKTSLV